VIQLAQLVHGVWDPASGGRQQQQSALDKQQSWQLQHQHQDLLCLQPTPLRLNDV
jgi:hypothetical protein